VPDEAAATDSFNQQLTIKTPEAQDLTLDPLPVHKKRLAALLGSMLNGKGQR
jgi:hypothetical protein